MNDVIDNDSEGRLVAARRDASLGAVHAGEADGRASADGADDRRVRRRRGAAAPRPPGGEGLGSWRARWCAAAASWACSASTCPRSTAASTSTRSRRSSSSERIARSASFATTFGGQANLCILPLVLFGTHEQKEKYLPRLVAGEMVGAYALSESGSGSDALAARTRATRQPDGSWVLNGEKMWITNGGFADVIIVFAKVDGEQFTAFIVETAFPGVSSGKEEHKMGLHGSSTTPILLQDARVPAGQRARRDRQGPQGRAEHAELRTLQPRRDVHRRLPRRRSATRRSTPPQRKQFGQPIATFGAIKHKLGEMIARDLRGREPDLPDRRPDRRGARRHRARRRGGGAGVRGVRRRGVDRQGGRQRDARLRARRERADSRRQRLRQRLPGRALLPRRAREPHLRGHQRDQPAADSRHADPPRAQGRAAAHRRREAAAGRAPVAVVAGGRLRRRRRARRTSCERSPRSRRSR